MGRCPPANSLPCPRCRRRQDGGGLGVLLLLARCPLVPGGPMCSPHGGGDEKSGRKGAGQLTLPLVFVALGLERSGLINHLVILLPHLIENVRHPPVPSHARLEHPALRTEKNPLKGSQSFCCSSLCSPAPWSRRRQAPHSSRGPQMNKERYAPPRPRPLHGAPALQIALLTTPHPPQHALHPPPPGHHQTCE